MPGHSIQVHLCKYKTMYQVQIFYSNFLDNKLLITSSFFLRLKKETKIKNKNKNNNTAEIRNIQL